MLDADAIRQGLRALQQGRDPTVFGAVQHGYVLAPTLSEAEAKAFEEKHRIVLPGEYRAFLTEVGNGGAGPFYGIFPLGLDDWGDPLEDEQFGSLERPFPGSLPVETPGLDFSPEHLLDGCLQIAHMGCALYVLLAVSGPLRESLWEDLRANDGGLRLLLDEKGGRLGFGDWYMAWLRSPLRIPSLGAAAPNTRPSKVGAWLRSVFRSFRRESSD
jgi:hypothetical protein